MRTNADLTAYLGGVNPATRVEEWTRVQVRCIVWENRRGESARGLSEDAVTVYIPYERGPISIKPGDALVRGLVSDEIRSGFTLSDLRRKYPDVVTVRSVDLMDMGSQALWHWQIGAT